MFLNMSINSSTFAVVPFMPSELTASNSSIYPTTSDCFQSKVSILVFIASYITFSLLLPLFILVLYLGCQQLRQQQFSSKAATRHSDAFLYHSIAMQLTAFLGFTLSFCGGYFNLKEMRVLGLGVWYVTWLGQSLFHFLTCVDRYLAVVKPITYQGLKQTGGVRIRNIVIVFVWLVSFGWLAVLYLTSFDLHLILHCCIMGFFIIGFSFCSISVLCALKRPGPGEVGGNRERVDQTKLKAFYTIVTIMGALLFRTGGNLISTIIYDSGLLGSSEFCVMYMCDVWYSVPSSLVLPLLFWHREKKLQCCKQAPRLE